MNQEIRRKLDRITNILFAGGVNNPITYIEQISYLIYLKLLDERESEIAIQQRLAATRAKSLYPEQAKRFRWFEWKGLSGEKLVKFVRVHRPAAAAGAAAAAGHGRQAGADAGQPGRPVPGRRSARLRHPVHDRRVPAAAALGPLDARGRAGHRPRGRGQDPVPVPPRADAHRRGPGRDPDGDPVERPPAR